MRGAGTRGLSLSPSPSPSLPLPLSDPLSPSLSLSRSLPFAPSPPYLMLRRLCTDHCRSAPDHTHLLCCMCTHNPAHTHYLSQVCIGHAFWRHVRARSYTLCFAGRRQITRADYALCEPSAVHRSYTLFFAGVHRLAFAGGLSLLLPSPPPATWHSAPDHTHYGGTSAHSGPRYYMGDCSWRLQSSKTSISDTCTSALRAGIMSKAAEQGRSEQELQDQHQ